MSNTNRKEILDQLGRELANILLGLWELKKTHNVPLEITRTVNGFAESVHKLYPDISDDDFLAILNSGMTYHQKEYPDIVSEYFKTLDEIN